MAAEFSSTDKYFVKPDGCNISCPREALAFYTEHKFVVKSNNVFSLLGALYLFLTYSPKSCYM